MFKYLSTIILANLTILGGITKVNAAHISAVSITNSTNGTVNDAHIRFTEKVKNVIIGGQNCTLKKPDNNGYGFIVDCDNFELSHGKKAKLTYTSKCRKCKIHRGKNTYWTVDDEEAGKIFPKQSGMTIGRNSPLSLSLFNEESFPVTFDNIQVFEGNDLSSFNSDNFETPTGTLVSGLPTSIILEPNTSTIIDLSTIVENPLTYVLATASSFPTSHPSEATSLSTAYDFGEEECIPEPSSIIGVFSLGILGAGATLKRKVKRSDSIKKDPTNVS